jgi:hypothetical protein
MDDKRLIKFINTASEIYNQASGRMSGVEKWRDKFENGSDERKYANKICFYLIENNKPNSFILVIRDDEKKKILEYLTNSILLI